MESPGLTKKKSYGISRGLGFWFLEFPRDATQFCGILFQVWSFYLSEIPSGKIKNENSEGFFKKVCPQTSLPPACFFFLE